MYKTLYLFVFPCCLLNILEFLKHNREIYPFLPTNSFITFIYFTVVNLPCSLNISWDVSTASYDYGSNNGENESNCDEHSHEPLKQGAESSIFIPDIAIKRAATQLRIVWLL